MAGAVLCIELDSLFSSVEELRHPDYAGRPLIIGADPAGGAGKGIVSGVNRAARKAGIKKGMPIGLTYQTCPHGIFLPVDFPAYRRVSGRIQKSISSVLPRVQRISIDEFLAELPERGLEQAKDAAALLCSRILQAEGISMRVGIGPNRLLAQLAVSRARPGLPEVIIQQDLKEKIWPLSTAKLYGVGRKTARSLADMGIRTIGDLAKADINAVAGLLGEQGYELHRMASGIDESITAPESESRSISREITFVKGAAEAESVVSTAEKLAEDIHRELLSGSFSFSTIGIKLRYDDLETHTRSRTIPITNSLDILKGHSKELLSPFLTSRKRIRLVGIRVENLGRNTAQRSIMDFEANK